MKKMILLIASVVCIFGLSNVSAAEPAVRKLAIAQKQAAPTHLFSLLSELDALQNVLEFLLDELGFVMANIPVEGDFDSKKEYSEALEAWEKEIAFLQKAVEDVSKEMDYIYGLIGVAAESNDARRSANVTIIAGPISLAAR